MGWGETGEMGAEEIEKGLERLVAAVEEATRSKHGWVAQLSAGLGAGLDFLSARPALAHLLLVESHAAARPARLEYERALTRLAAVLRPPPVELGGSSVVPEETARLLAGGLASHLSGRVLAGEAGRLGESHELLLSYLLAPSPSARPGSTVEHRG